MAKSQSKKGKRRNRNVEVRWDKADAVWEIYQPTLTYSVDWFSTKVDAVAEGRRMAKELKCELVVKNKNGRVGWRNSYGGDSPRRPG